MARGPFIPLLDSGLTSIRLNPNSSHKLAVRWSDLKNLLMSEGEALAPRDLEECLSILMGEKKFASDEESSIEMNAAAFATSILGFEDFSST